MIVFISDFDLHGSGYMQIAISLCKQLVARGHTVKAFGIGYDGNEHHWPFSILPVKSRTAFVDMPAMLANLRALSQVNQVPPIEAIVVALDVPLQQSVLSWPQRAGIPQVGIFPIESGPLMQSWANVLMSMERALVMSEFGLKCMEARSVPGAYIPIGIDSSSWRPPTGKERIRLRKAMSYEDKFIVLTVADNQERKNLSAAMQTIASLKRRGLNVEWTLVTRENSGVGWNLRDMTADLDLIDQVTIFERGLPFERLWMLYAAADAFLLTSKAEGLCMPVLEAMASGLPVVATDCTAIPEHIFAKTDGALGMAQRGFPIRAAHQHIDPWGNSVRTYVDPEYAALQLLRVRRMRAEGTLQPVVDRARQYAESRTWDRAGEVLDAAVREVMVKPETAVHQIEPEPITVPRIIPIREGEEDE